MRVSKGQAILRFAVEDVSGKTISLDDYNGQHVLLSFFRNAGCPFCNLTLIKLIERYKNFSNRGLQTIAFFQSPKETVNEYVVARQPPFPIIADPNKEVYDKYAIETSLIGGIKSVTSAPARIGAIIRGDVVLGRIDGDAFLMPAQFIIGPDGAIVRSHYGTDFGDKIPLIEIEEILLTQVVTPR